jgi:Domain of unknown function (DUF5621)
MPDIFTIYCHGSGGHRDKADKELVVFLGKHAVGEEYKDYLILDGVGGKPTTTKAQNPMAGTFNWADKNKSAKGKTSVELGGGKTKGAIAANATGFGVEDNARHAVVTIANLPKPPKTVNMVGWSRGSITAMMIAYMLFDPETTEGLFRGIDVNIFAIDPVAGADAGIGQGSASRRSITANVKNFLGVLATGENRKTFSPQDLSRVHIHDASSNVMFLPFPGKHSTPAQDNDPKGLQVSEITWSMGVQFLRNFGTPCPNPRYLLSQRDYLEKYSHIVLNRESFAKIKQKGLKQRMIGLGFGKRDLTQKMSDYVQYSDYFINEHHRAVFDQTMPRLSSWLFTPAGPGGGGTNSTQVQAELAWAKDFLPDTVASLVGLMVTRDAAGKFTLPIAGSFTDPIALHDVQARGDLMRMGVLV